MHETTKLEQDSSEPKILPSVLRHVTCNMNIFISGLEVFVPFEFKDNLTVSMVSNTGETGDIYRQSSVKKTTRKYS